MKENGRNNREVFYWDLQDERRFIYDGMDIIEERDGSNNLIAFYTRTGNIGEVLSRTTSINTFYYHYDGNGNVVSLTDASENVVATYEYDAYGNLQASSGAEANNNPFRFSTKYFDVTAGFYDYGFRFYDPVTGRWLSRDPIAEAGGINLYAFVGNGPVNRIDAIGLAIVELRYWYLFQIPLGGGKSAKFYHAYIVVSENDGSKPYIFHGWHGGNFNPTYDPKSQCVGINGYLSGSSGSFTSDWPEYKNSSTHPSQIFVNKDNKPAKFYIDKFNTIKDLYNQDKVLYNYLGPNSNTLVWQILKRSLPRKMPWPIKSIPGFNSDKLWD